MELVRQALADIREQEIAAIAARVRARTEAVPGMPSDEDLLKDKAQRFIYACHKNDEASRRRGFARLRHGRSERRAGLYFDHFEADFVTSDELNTLVVRKWPVYREMGTRSHTFSQQPLVVDGSSLEIGAEVLTVGWQVGFVESRERLNPSVDVIVNQASPGSRGYTYVYEDGRKHSERADNREKPVRIWQVVTATAVDGPRVERRAVTHDIDIRSGALTTYDETLQNDEIKGFSAGMFAIGILQGAIEYVEGT